MNALERIVERTRGEVAARMAVRPQQEVEEAADVRMNADPPRGFAEALRAPGLAVIAEHKRRSPSAGAIREDSELEDVVGAYERGGARALSVLTEQVGFGGRLEDLDRARRAATLPILRKDFIVGSYQVFEAAAAGADAILLIVAVLTPDELAGLHLLANRLGLDALVEVHDAAELAVAVALRPQLIGVNNRDLTTLQVDVGRTMALAPQIPAGTVTVAESGFRTRNELEALSAAGVDAVLIGEALMRADDIEAACAELTGSGLTE